jgi:hypothetical protein
MNDNSNMATLNKDPKTSQSQKHVETKVKEPSLSQNDSIQPPNGNTTTTSSLLLELPPELRNIIFALALTHSCGIHFRHSCSSSPGDSLISNPPHPFNLLYVCRQSRAETLLVPFALNDIFVRSEYSVAIDRFIQAPVCTEADILLWDNRFLMCLSDAQRGMMRLHSGQTRRRRRSEIQVNSHLIMRPRRE